jgi:hypothetical protein
VRDDTHDNHEASEDDQIAAQRQYRKIHGHYSPDSLFARWEADEDMGPIFHVIRKPDASR